MTFWTICPKMWAGGEDMPDYRELYFALFRNIEKAINILIEAQREAEEKILSCDDERIVLLSRVPLDEQNNEKL